jgi:predicted nucleotidyltransferase
MDYSPYICKIIRVQLDRPFLLLSPTVDGDVLSKLALAEAEFTPPQVHRLIGRHSVEGVRNALQRLAEQGIVLQRRAGMAMLYQLNRSHLAAPAVIAIARIESQLIERLRDRFGKWSIRTPYSALFGSAATGQMRHDSDLDIFIVRPARTDPESDTWRSQFDQLSRDCSLWTGNDCRILEYSATEVVRAISSNDAVIQDIRSKGIRLVGASGYLFQSTKAAA